MPLLDIRRRAPLERLMERPSPDADARPVWVAARDCREALPELPDRSVSLVLTDPPYFIDGMDDGWDNGRLRGRLREGVVGGVPCGMKFDTAQGRNLQEFLTPVAREWMRLLKPGGFVLCFSQARLAHHAAMAVERAGFEIRDALAWRYEGQGKAFTQDHFVRRRNLPPEEEARILAELGGRKTPQLKAQMEAIILGQAPRSGTFVENWLEHRTGLIDVSNPLIDPAKSPGQVIAVPKPREKHGHLTAKPVDLLRHLIRIFSDDRTETIVLDPFAGSGSTGVAARMEGRSFIGYEVDERTARAANERVERMRA